MNEQATTPGPVQLALSARETAAALSVSESTLLRLRKGGSLPSVHLGARVVFRIETVRAWLAREEKKQLDVNDQ